MTTHTARRGGGPDAAGMIQRGSPHPQPLESLSADSPPCFLVPTVHIHLRLSIALVRIMLSWNFIDGGPGSGH